MKALCELSIAEAGRLLREGRLTSQTLTEDALSRIGTIDPKLHSFVLVTAEKALEDARRADGELGKGIDRGPMHGIPYAVKDIFATAGIPTTCHSKLMAEHRPSENAFVVSKLEKGGAVLLGKLATHEFALGGPSFDLPFPPARNPWNTDFFTGASSSGSGAAVAAGLTRVALGSDTSGSIRGPACHCGTVGLKPTYGVVSRRGAFPLSYSLDHCGPLSWTVEDAAIVMGVIAGFDPMDPSSVESPALDFTAGLQKDVAGLKIAYPRSFFADVDSVSTEVVDAIDLAADRLARLGAHVEEVTLPAFELFNACGRTIMIAEGYAIHEHDLKTRPLSFGRYTYQRLIAGAAISAADLVQAHRLRRELVKAVDEQVFGKHDVMIAACCLWPPMRLADFPLDWPPPRRATATQTIPFNVTGHPSLAIPVGFTSDGLPLGMQIVGRAFEDPTVICVGAAFEAAAGSFGPRQRPKIACAD